MTTSLDASLAASAVDARHRFFFGARTQHQNLGDGVITRELLRLLRSRGAVDVFESGMPPPFLDLIEAQRTTRHARRMSFLRQLLGAALRRRLSRRAPRVYYVLNPGGFNGGYRNSDVPRQLLVIGGYALLVALGVRIIRLGQSVGPYHGVRERLERWKARWLHAFTVRDPISMRYAMSNRIGAPTYFPDFALLMAAPPPHPAGGYAVASFRSEPQRDGYDEAVSAALRELMTGSWQGLPLRFPSQVSFDVKRNAELAKQLKDMPGGATTIADVELESLLACYGSADVVFSNRLHVVLLALRTGTPAYAVVDRDVNGKVIGILEELGLHDFVIDIRKFRRPALLQDRAAFQRRVHVLFEDRKERAAAALDAILA